MITNTDPHNSGTVGVVRSGGLVSTVVVLEDTLEKGEKDDEGEHDFADGDDEDEDADHILLGPYQTVQGRRAPEHPHQKIVYSSCMTTPPTYHEA